MEISLMLSREHFKMWFDAEQPREVLLDLLHEGIQTSSYKQMLDNIVPGTKLVDARVVLDAEL